MTSFPKDYEFPSPWPKPMDHQIVTSVLHVKHKRCFDLNDIGTSKTASALWAADFLMRHGLIRKVLVLAPLSTLQRVWAEEIYKLFPGKRTSGIAHGSKAKRFRVFSEDYDYYIMNHDGLKSVMNFKGGDRARDPRRALISKEFAAFLKDVDLVIVDEGAVFRNSRTDLWLAAKTLFLTKKMKPNRLAVWWLTGALVVKAPTDAWAQVRLVNPALVPRYFSRFRDVVMQKVSQFKWVEREGWENIVYPMIQPSVRFERKDCVDLPPEIWETRTAELSKEQKKFEATVKAEAFAQIEDKNISAVNEGALRTKLLQIYTGAVYSDLGESIILDYKPRLRVLKEAIVEAKGKCIIYAPFKHTQRVLLGELSKDWTVSLVNGEVSRGKRDGIFADFQHGDLQILLAHPECMAHGLTLTASNVIIWWAPIDDWEIAHQANGRIKRPGQTKPQVVVEIYAGVLERQMYERLRKKEKMQGLLMNLVKTDFKG